VRGVSGSLFASLLLVLALPGGTHAEALLRGQPRIIDGDTIEIGNTKIRLEGIDAPETDQLCLDTKGAEWACGIAARDQLIRRAGDVEWVCVQHGSDRYRRTLATCTVDGEDINKWMVSAGWALSFTRYSHAYDNDET
jgi:endonuclease YncB( thermonuclease family)